jgi:hypothetical protein
MMMAPGRLQFAALGTPSSTTSYRLPIRQAPMCRPLSGQLAPQAYELVLVDAEHVLDLSAGKGP